MSAEPLLSTMLVAPTKRRVLVTDTPTVAVYTVRGLVIVHDKRTGTETMLDSLDELRLYLGEDAFIRTMVDFGKRPGYDFEV